MNRDMLQKMVRQRQESIELYKQGNRQELVDKEQAEIDLIERYMPKKLSEAEQEAARAGFPCAFNVGRQLSPHIPAIHNRMFFGRRGSIRYVHILDLCIARRNCAIESVDRVDARNP